MNATSRKRDLLEGPLLGHPLLDCIVEPLLETIGKFALPSPEVDLGVIAPLAGGFYVHTTLHGLLRKRDDGIGKGAPPPGQMVLRWSTLVMTASKSLTTSWMVSMRSGNSFVSSVAGTWKSLGTKGGTSISNRPARALMRIATKTGIRIMAALLQRRATHDSGANQESVKLTPAAISRAHSANGN
jgi:hypothetical protein